MPVIYLDKRRARRALDPRYAELFALIAELRAPSPAHLHALFFSPVLRVHASSAYRRLQTLAARGYVAHGCVAGTQRRYVHLTKKGLLAFPSVARAFSENVRKPPPPDVAAYGWQRAALHAALVDDGYRVGRGIDALLALRRSLVDEQQACVAAASPTERDAALNTLRTIRASPLLTPLMSLACGACGRAAPSAPQDASCPGCGGAIRQVVVRQPLACERCGAIAEDPGAHDATGCDGAMRPRPYLPFDVAHRRVGGVRDVVVVFVDNPYRSLERQLQELPLRFLGQPRVKVILRASDDESIWDETAQCWAHMGPRLRRLLRAFSEFGRVQHFPYWRSAEVVTYRPELVLRTAHKKGNRHAS